MVRGKEYETKPGGGLIGQAVAGATEQAEEVSESIDQTMDSAAQAVQDTIRRTKKTAAAAVQSVADGVETSTEYLSERGVAGVVEDLETLIRRYPLQALLIGLSLGYLFTRSRHR
ncbi:MAG: hypothetical protein Q7U39_15090 [Nitrospira sp.]|nr:hypothetical protein [Nitrospira sp.]